MPTVRWHPSIGVINGILYAVGGFNGSTTFATVEAYDPLANTWTTKAAMPTARLTPGVAVINGILYAAGGINANTGATFSTLEAYDPVTNTWTTRASMPTVRGDPAAGVVDGILYVVGGSGASSISLATVEAYDPATDTWATKASMPTSRCCLGAGVVNGILYAVGGNDALNFLATLEAFTPPLDILPPAAPTSLYATTGDGQIDLFWNPNSEADFLKYYIYGGTTPGPTTVVDSTAGGDRNDASATLASLSNGITYYYRITAMDNSGNESAYSNEVSAVPPIFTRVTSDPVTTDGSNSRGGSWGDYDNDGDLDLFVPKFNQASVLYINNGNGSFTALTADPVVTSAGDSRGSSWGDYDNDGDLDLFVANFSSQNNFLYTNNGNGSFTAVINDPIVTSGGESLGSSWGDYDNDGDLDLFVANFSNQNNFLYINNGDGSFTAVTSDPVVTSGGISYGGSWGDYDNDGDLDLFVANWNQNNFLYVNNGDGSFTAITSGPVVTSGGESLGGSWGDYDNDGDLDLFVANNNQNNFLYVNNGDGSFTAITSDPVVTSGGNSQGSSWGDYDNDGDLDLFVANKDQNNFLYVNNGDGSFTAVTSDPVVTSGGSSQGSAWGDYDNDGDLDLFVANLNQNNFLYTNNGNANHWINLALVGRASNVSAIGAKVRLKATIESSPLWQLNEISGQTGGSYGGQNSLNAEFGLGSATIIDSIRIEWPSGIVQVLVNVAIDQFLTITEPDTTQPAAPALTFIMSGMNPHLGQKVEGRLIDLYSGLEVDRDVIATLPATTDTLFFDGAQAGSDTRLEFFADYNGNGLYDPPATDHAWRVDIPPSAGDTTVQFSHHTNFIDIGWDYSLTANLSGLDAATGQALQARLLDAATGREITRLAAPQTVAAAMTVTLPGLVPGRNYNLDLWIDTNGNGLYDAPDTDEAWRIPVTGVVADAVVNFSHSTQYTDIGWRYAVTLNLQAMEPNLEQLISARLINESTGEIVGRQRRELLPLPAISLRLPGLEAGVSYRIDFFADNNGNGEYDAPPTDHAWRITGLVAQGDMAYDFSRTTTYTDIQWQDEAIVEENVPTGDGEITFGATGVTLDITFSSQTGADTIEVTLNNQAPDGAPPSGLSLAGDRYWTIIHNGASTFSIDLTLTAGVGAFTANEISVPGNLKLLRRASDGSGAWVAIRRAVSATDSAVTFAGLTGFSQFVISRNMVTDVLGPTVSTPTLSATPSVNQSVSVEVTVFDPGGVQQAILGYLEGSGQAPYSQVTMTLQTDNTTYSAAVPPTAVTPAGILFYVQAADSLGNQSSPDTTSIQLTFSAGAVTTANTGSLFNAGFPRDSWRLISIPADADDKSASAIIGGGLEGAAAGDKSWQVYRFTGPGNEDYATLTSFVSGSSYFLKQVVADNPHFDLGAGTTTALDRINLTLTPGQWYFIATPFAFPVSVSADQGLFSGPYTYGAFGSGGQEGWSTARYPAILQPWGGHIIYNTSDQTQILELLPPSLQKQGPPAVAKVKAIDGWSVNFAIEGDNYYDGNGRLGRLAGAAEGADPLDRPSLPVMEGFLALSSRHPDWNGSETYLSADIRSPEVSDGAWDLVLEAAGETGPITLTYTLDGDLPPAMALIDLLERKVYDLRSGDPPAVVISDYRQPVPYGLRVIAGSAQYVTTGTQATLANLPKKFALLPNYPNPFNPSTTLRYELPRPAKVTLQVYNLLGQELLTLSEGWQALGRYEVVWSERDRSGRAVSTGVYFAVLRADGRAITRKMVLLK